MTEHPGNASEFGDRPLDGIRVLELGQLVAGPFAGAILAYFGAEVIKVEPPEGDPLRSWRVLDDDGTSLWWRTLARNKKAITLDLRKERGRVLARRLAERVDVLIEGFRPGTLERWGLDPDTLREANPGLLVARVSGFGQTGPDAHKPGFAAVCEGVGGMRYVNGEPGERPLRHNLSLGDSLAGMHAALGILLALFERQRRGRAQTVDVAITEAVFNMLESMVPDYDRRGVVRQPSGSTITGVVPTNTYPTRDGKWLIIGASGDSIYRRMMQLAGRPDLASDPDYATNDRRAPHQEMLDGAIAAWTSTLDLADALERLEEAAVPAGPIQSIDEVMRDPQFQARGMFEEVEVGGRPLKVGAIPPKLSATPGRSEWAGPELGEHTEEVLGGELGLSAGEIADLRASGVI